MDRSFLGSSPCLSPPLCFCFPPLLLCFPFSYSLPNLYLKNFLRFSLPTLLSSHSLKTSASPFLQLPLPKKSPITQLYGTPLFSFLTCFNHHHGKVVTSFATHLSSFFMEVVSHSSNKILNLPGGQQYPLVQEGSTPNLDH